MPLENQRVGEVNAYGNPINFQLFAGKFAIICTNWFETHVNKAKNLEEARNAFVKFCSCYEERAAQMALVHCSKWKKPESVAYQIVQCAFQKIWQYPTFDKSKSKCKDTDRAILNWIFWIMVHELTLLSQSGDCSHPEAEDLPLITNPSEFIGEFFNDEYVSNESFERMKVELENRLSKLNEKEITIYLRSCFEIIGKIC